MNSQQSFNRFLGAFGASLAVIIFFAAASIATASLTFSGTGISGDSGVNLDTSSTISIGTASSTGITIGRPSITVSFPGNVSTTNLAIVGLAASGTSPCLSLTGSGAVATTTCGAGGSSTIPNTLDLLIGGVANTAMDSGIATNTLALKTGVFTDGSIPFTNASGVLAQSDSNVWINPTALGTGLAPTLSTNGTPGGATYGYQLLPLNSYGPGYGLASNITTINTGPNAPGLTSINSINVSTSCGSEPTGTKFVVYRTEDNTGTYNNGPIGTVTCGSTFVDTGIVSNYNYLTTASLAADLSQQVSVNGLGTTQLLLKNGNEGSQLGNVYMEIWPGYNQNGQGTGANGRPPLILRDQQGNIAAWWQPANGIWALQDELEFANYPGGAGEQTMYESESGINMGSSVHLSWSNTPTSPSTPDTEICRSASGTVEFGTTTCNSSGSLIGTNGTFLGLLGVGTTAPSRTLQVAGPSSTIRIGAGSIPGCLELMDSSGNGTINYLTATGGSLSATTTKPVNCQ